MSQAALPAPKPVRNSGTPQQAAALSNLTLVSYAAPAMPLALVGLPLAVYLPAIYADSAGFGLSLFWVGWVLTLSRLTDAFTDPLLGFISDRTRTRWGRRKPFILLGTPIYALGVWLLFVPPVEFQEWGGFNLGYLYLFAMVSLVYLGSTIKDLPYSAWGAELSARYHERTLIVSWREGFQLVGALISSCTPLVILFFGYTKPTDAVYFLAVLMSVAMPLLVLNALIVVPEHPVIETPERLPLRESLRYVAQNGPYVRLVAIFILSTLGSAMTNSLSFFFVKHVLLAGDLYGLYLAPYFISQIAALPLWLKLSRRIGKHRTVMAAIGWYALWSLFIPAIAIAPQAWFELFEIPSVFAFLPAGQVQALTTYFEGIPSGKFLFFVGVMCLKGASIGALGALPAAMAADVVDVDSASTGRRRAGAYFSIWAMTRKGAYALGITVGTSLAVIFGFDSLADPIRSPNSAEALFSLSCLYSVVPALFQLAAMPMLWWYPLDETSVARIQERMRASSASAQPSPS